MVDLIAESYQRVIPESASGALLDLGCGRVPLYGTYRDRAFTVTCVDWVNSPHDTGHIDVAADLNEALPLPSSSYETVILSDVLEHIARPWTVWSEISRIIKPGGRLIGNVPFMYWIHESPHDYHRYTEHALRRYASDNGFEAEVEVIGGLLDVLADISAKLICRIPVIGKGLARAVAGLFYSFGRTKLGTRARLKTAEFFPLAYGFVMTRAPKSLDLIGADA